MSNPLLTDSPLPLFAEIKEHHIEEAMTRLEQTVEEKITQLEDSDEDSFASIYSQLENISVPVEEVKCILYHLQGVKNTEGMRLAFEKAIPTYSKISNRIAQSKPLYQKFLKLSKDKNIDSVQQRIVSLRIKYAKQFGVSLEGEKKARFNAITEELMQQQTKFSNNVLDARKQFKLILQNENDTAGLHPDFLKCAAEQYKSLPPAERSNSEGWLVTLEHPSYVPFMEYSERRDLREKLYRAHISVASQDPYNNTEVINDILRLKQEQAHLLGFNNYAEFNTSYLMAKNVTNVKSLLNKLHLACYEKGNKEFDDLQKHAKEHGQQEELKHWDISYWARRMEEDIYAIDENKIRRYFPLSSVLPALFSLCEQLFAISIEECTSTAQTWHKDVIFYKIYNRAKKHIASFYLDPYSRPSLKSGGAWMTSLKARRKTHAGKLCIPVASMACNFTPPLQNHPSLLDMYDIKTLFHEFGHALHHMLTKVDYLDISGIAGVEDDFIELPSQFMENFAYLTAVIKDMSCHIDSKESLPADLLEKLRAKKNFRAASLTLRQLLFSKIDIELYENPQSHKSNPFAIAHRLSTETIPLPYLPNDMSICSFLHIFAGGYSAGYYGYKWAEVLSADAFSLFEKNGLEDKKQLRKTGLHYLETILSSGGSIDPATLFEKFRGRPYNIDAYLRSYDLQLGSTLD